jgi:stage V sporulation protein G
MNITEIRVKLVGENAERLKAFCSMTLDGSFVIRDLKVIEGANGPFVAMPSRKLADRCPKCGSKNHLRARHCNECGARLKEDRVPRDSQGRVKLHADVAHPINTACRELIQGLVIEAYRKESEQAKQPGYQSQALDDEEFGSSDYDGLIVELKESAHRRKAGRDDQRGRDRTQAPSGDVEQASTGQQEGTTGSITEDKADSSASVSLPSGPGENQGKGFASGIL